MLTTHRYGRTDEGSMPMALLAAIIGVGIATVLFSSVLTSQRTVRFDRDFTTSFHGADAGVQAALAEIRTLEQVGSVADGYVIPLTTDNTEGVTFTYTATKDGTKWKVTATGDVDGNPERTVEGEVSRESRFSMAAFGKTLVGFKGGNGAASYDGTNVNTGVGSVGTNGDIELNGSAYADLLLLYGPTAQCAKTAANCDAMEAADKIAGEPAPYVADTDFIEEALAASWCTTAFTSYRASVDGPLEGGAGPGPDGEYCFSSMAFDHGTATNLPVTGTENLVVYVSGTVSSQNDSMVNCPACESLPNNPSQADINAMLASNPPDSRRLQIYSTGAEVALGNHTHIGGAIYAPNASCHGNPSNAQGYIYGSMVCNDINNQGGWSFWYDERLEEIDAETWRIKGIREEVGGSTSF